MTVSHLSAALLCSLFLTSAGLSAQAAGEARIWYDQPAPDWDHALPAGNGRLGAMVFGNPVHERLQLNEDSLWPGGPEWGDAHGTPADLARATADSYDYLAFLREAVTDFMERGGGIEDVGTIDQSRFSYLANYEALKGRNAQRVYEELEWE